ncbi:DinB family protein [Pedobacter sp. UYP30]|uniref:DinB family protein n=1 Tax=Pedobacter sp. UYP30 TaxID=1756400 RepID=UPI0033951654
MKEIFEFITNAREAFIRAIDTLSNEQLNKIPEGYNNNIIWNFGHIVVTTQALCYVRTGVLPDGSSIKYNDFYKKDTRPTYTVSAEEVAELKTMALESVEKIKEDYDNGLFSNMIPFATATYGAQINSVEETIITTIGHDNMHFGYALALKKLLV